MRAFASMVMGFSETGDTAGQSALLETYFRSVAPEDAVWALSFLTGERLPAGVNATELLLWAAEESNLPMWLVDQSRAIAGDPVETASLILPGAAHPIEVSLHQLVESTLVPLARFPDHLRRERVTRAWRELDASAILVFNRLLAGSLRFARVKSVLSTALANIAGVSPAVITYRLSLLDNMTPEEYPRLIGGPKSGEAPRCPYPFTEVGELAGPVAALGDCSAWQADFSWPGVRAQLVCRRGQFLLWSIDGELLTSAFPEIAETARVFADGTVLDGMIVAWSGGKPLETLQKRLNRPPAGARMRREVPVVFMVWDILEDGMTDLRSLPLTERALRLALVSKRLGSSMPVRCSPSLAFANWTDAEEARANLRAAGASALLLRPRSSDYHAARLQSAWRVWKPRLHIINAVLISAKTASSGTSAPFDGLTFGVWRDGQLLPVAETGMELAGTDSVELEARLRRHIRSRFGPVHLMQPGLVAELEFEGVQVSPRRKSGLVLREPRVKRWYLEQAAAEAGKVSDLVGLLHP